MIEKENLLKEIFPEMKTKSSFILEGFEDKELEKDFLHSQAENYKLGLLAICIMICVLNVYHCIYALSVLHRVEVISIFITLTTGDILLLCLLYTKLSENAARKLRIVKFLFNAVTSFVYMMMYLIYDSENKEASIARIFYFHGLMMCIEYVYLIRTNSRILFSVLFVYLVILIISSITTYELRFGLGVDLHVGFKKSCSSLVNYHKWNDKEKSRISRSFLEGFISTKNSIQSESLLKSFREITREKILNVMNTDKIEELILLDMAMDNLFSDNPDLDDKLLENAIIAYINIMPDNETDENACFVYYYSEVLASFILGNNTNVSLSIKKRHNYFCHVLEIITCLLGPLIYYVLSLFSKYRREIFISIKKTEMLISYYKDFINNIHSRIVSFTNDTVLFYNSSFEVDFRKFYNIHNEVMTRPVVVALDSEFSISETDKNNYENSKSNNNSNKQESLHISSLVLFFSNLILETDNETSQRTTLNDILELCIDKINNSNNIIPLNTETRNLTTQHNSKKSNSSLKSNTKSIKTNNLFFKQIGIFSYKKHFYYKISVRQINQINNNGKDQYEVILEDISETRIAERISSETKLKQKLFSKIAHEFKTPLLIMKSFVSSLLTIHDAVEQETKINNIIYLSEYISYLINDIIYYANDKEITVVQEDVSLSEINDFCLGLVEALVKAMPGSRSVKAVLDRSAFPGDVVIVSDGIRLKQILINFISNAVKFTKNGEIRIVSVMEGVTEEELEQGVDLPVMTRVLKIKVIDTGLGIKENDLKKIVAKNTGGELISIDTEFKYNQMGTGLGINIAKNLISKLGFSFFVRSVCGVGTEFTVIIPNNVKKASNVDNNCNTFVVNDSFTENNMNTTTLLPLRNFNFITNKSINISRETISMDIEKRSVFGNEIKEDKEEEINLDPLTKEKASNSKSNDENNDNDNDKFLYNTITNTNQISSKMLNSAVKKFHNKSKKNSLFSSNNYKNRNNSENRDNNKDNTDNINTQTNIVLINNQSSINTINDKLTETIIQSQGKRFKIMIVDDSPYIRQAAKNIIAKNDRIIKDFHVIEGNDGVDMLYHLVLAQNTESQVKLIITDENMEYMCGSSAIEIIRQMEKENKIGRVHLISLTAFSDECTVKEIMRKGADKVMFKPLKLNDFNRYVDENWLKIVGNEN